MQQGTAGDPTSGDTGGGRPGAIDLGTVARQQADAAARANSGRAAATVFGGSRNTLRQTVIAIRGGSGLADHENPGEATLQVLSGRVRLAGASGEGAEGTAGSLLVIPDERHTLQALEDSVVLLTVGKH